MGPYPMVYGSQGRTTHTDVREMVECTPDTDLIVIPDLISSKDNPVDLSSRDCTWGMVQMRNMAIFRGLEYHHLLLIENNVRVHKDTLLKLLSYGESILIPRPNYVSYPSIGARCFGPSITNTYPLHPLRWSAHSIVLFHMPDVVRVPVMFAGVAESVDHKRWQKYIGPAHMALDVPVDILRIPTGFREEFETQALPKDYE